MSESIGGMVPLDSMLAGIVSDVARGGYASDDTLAQLVAAVNRHVAGEAEALDEYEYLSTASHDPVIALVMRLILDDEMRHHGLLTRIATTLQDALDWTRSPTALPTQGPTVAMGNEQQLVLLAKRLIEEEKSGARALRHLAEREKSIDAGLDTLLLEMMALDSEKHARMLAFVEHRVEARIRATRASS